MGALAGLLVESGEEVRGSDKPLYPPMSDLLHELKIPLAEGYATENLEWNPDVVVLGNTCGKDHVEYLEAQRRGIPVVSFPQLLGDRFLAKRHSIVVAGTHGKTTTTSLLAYLLTKAGLEPGYLVGGIPLDFGRSFSVGQAPYFVVEGDEYDSACFDKEPKFVHYRPQTVILTGIEFDHADIYADMDAVIAAFTKLIDAIPEDGLLLVSCDSDVAMRLAKRARCRVEAYAVSSTSDNADVLSTRKLVMPLDWYGSYERLGGGRQRLNISFGEQSLGSVELTLKGAHNMANTLAAVGVAYRLGVGMETASDALSNFSGIARRQQVRGVVNNITVIDDFAHHPTAIRETLKALQHRRGNLVAVFEPRSATSRRKVFEKIFPEALAVADRVVLAPIFAPEKIPAEDRLDLDSVLAGIHARGKEAALLPNADAIAEELAASLVPGDTVVVMSSGGFDGLHEKLLDGLRHNAPANRRRSSDSPKRLDPEEALEVATEAAREVAHILREGFRQTIAIERKDGAEIVTEYDRKAEALLVEKLHARFPDHRIIGEEGGTQGAPGDHRPTWYLDPIDGTTNFARHIPWYAISIALEVKGRLRVGLVLAPENRWELSAVRGGGALLNGHPIRVSDGEDLRRSLLGTGFPYERKDFDNTEHLHNALQSARGVRRMGTASLDCLAVACGWLDGYWEYRLRPWDVAAGALLVEEAGGRVTLTDGKPFDLHKGDIVATNGHIHEQLLVMLRRGKQPPENTGR